MKIPKELKTVTPFSKLLSLLMIFFFILLFFIAGMQVQKIFDNEQLLSKEMSKQEVKGVSVNRFSKSSPEQTYCSEQGGKILVLINTDGTEATRCVFADGRDCEVKNFFSSKVCK